MSIYRDSIQQLCTVFPQGEATAMMRIVMEERFGLSQTDLLLGKDNELSANDISELQIIVGRLSKSEPLQYVLGCTDFCNLKIRVAPGVLIPRPETEELVRWIDESEKDERERGESEKRERDAGVRAKSEAGEKSRARVLDIGTGSGCIALALASLDFEVEAWDVSQQALSIARSNAEALGLDVKFRMADILSSDCTTTNNYDIIVSNPPYICEKEKSDMDSNVLDHEPHLALFVPDSDPLLFYRTIARFASKTLSKEGLIFFEINRAYANETISMLQQVGFCDIELRHDQFGNARMIKARLK